MKAIFSFQISEEDLQVEEVEEYHEGWFYGKLALRCVSAIPPWEPVGVLISYTTCFVIDEKTSNFVFRYILLSSFLPIVPDGLQR